MITHRFIKDRYDLRMLDPRLLETLRVVVEVGSLRGAAEQLGYTPSAVSQHISRLADQAGVPLIEADGRGIRPTSAGRVLARQAVIILRELTEAEALLGALASGGAGSLSLVSFATAGAQLIPPVLAGVREEFPDLELTLRIAEGEEALRLIRRGLADVALIETHADSSLDTQGLSLTPLLDDPFHIVLPRSHALARRRRLTLDALANEDWIDITCEVGCCRQETNAAFSAARFVPRRVVQADEYWPAQGFVAAGLGTALVPGLALGVRHEGVVVRPVADDRPPVRRVLAVTRGSEARRLPVAAAVSSLRREARRQRKPA